jgi:hypothetical protein
MRHRSHRLLFRAVVAVSVPALALLAAAVPASARSASAGSASVSPVGQAARNARQFLDHLIISHPAALGHRLASAHRVGSNTVVESTSWAGYADIERTYSEVSGKWKQPTITCTSQTSLVAFWTGLDGFSSSTVEQDGTLAECYDGTAYSYTWWEMYPGDGIQVVGDTVQPGDVISSSVTVSGASYTLKVTDSTHSASSFTTTQTCSGCADSSAEWIAEAPTGDAGTYPIPKFTPWTEYDATVKSGGTTGDICTFPYDQINGINSVGQDTLTTGPLNPGCTSFTVTWERGS